MKIVYALVIAIFCSFANILLAIPTVTTVGPNRGPVSGGTPVIITGTGFTGTSAVEFGTNFAPEFDVVNDTLLIVTTPQGVLGTIYVNVVTPEGTSLDTQAASFTYQGDWIGYASSNTPFNEVVAFDTANQQVQNLIATGQFGASIAITPDNTKAYVVSLSTNQVTVIDLINQIVLTTIPVGINPVAVAITPNGQTAYVVNDGSQSVTPIDIATNTPGEEITLFGVGQLTGIAISPDGQTAYVINSDFISTIIPIDLTTATQGIPTIVATNPVSIKITPDGLTAYVVSNIASGVISVIDLTTQTFKDLIVLGNAYPIDIALSPDGLKGYVTYSNQGCYYNYPTPIDCPNMMVSVIDLTTDSLLDPILNVLGGGGSIFITPDGKNAFVAGQGTSLITPLDLINNIAETPFSSDAFLDFPALTITPDPAPYAFFTVDGRAAGSPTVFDASQSTTAVGTIVSYDWDFGDGTNVTTASPFITHTYATAGIYQVSLTVTNSAGTSTTIVFTGQTVSRNGGPQAQYSLTIAIAPLVLLPPRDIKGHQYKNRFLSRVEIVNVITGLPPLVGDQPVLYILYRDPALQKPIQSIKATNHLRFEDYKIKKGKTYTYYIVSEDASGNRSAPVSVTISPN